MLKTPSCNYIFVGNNSNQEKGFIKKSFGFSLLQKNTIWKHGCSGIAFRKNYFFQSVTLFLIIIQPPRVH